MPAVAVNHDTQNARENSIRNVSFECSLYALAFTHWIASPEMCLGDSGFAALLKDPRWSRSILFMVVDEAQCIKQWGIEFRKHYTSLETLRSFVLRGVWVLTTSATMPPETLEQVRSILGMNTEKFFHLNLGNHRYNIVPLVWPMEGG